MTHSYSNVHVRYPYLSVGEVRAIEQRLTASRAGRTVVALDSNEWFTLHSDLESVKIDVKLLKAIYSGTRDIADRAAGELQDMKFIYDDWLNERIAEAEDARNETQFCEIAVMNPFMNEEESEFLTNLLYGAEGRSVIVSDSQFFYHQKFQREDVAARSELLDSVLRGEELTVRQRRLVELDLIDAGFWLSGRLINQAKVGA